MVFESFVDASLVVVTSSEMSWLGNGEVATLIAVTEAGQATNISL